MGTGVGEAMLIGAAVGAGSGALGSAIQGGDVMQGALLGAGTGAIGGAASGAFGAASGAAGGGAGGAGASGAGAVGTSGFVPSSTGIMTLPAEVGITSVAPTATATTNVFGQTVGLPGVLSNPALATIGGTSALGGAMQAERDQYGMPSSSTYTGGPLNQFRYNPATYRSDVVIPPNPVYRPSYADGGIATLMDRPSYPQSGIDRTQYATPSQMPTSAEVVASDYDTKVSPYTGQMMAKGGIADLGGYSDGGRMLKGPGDGMSDSIPGVIGGRQPARLADGEFVVPADVVSHLGNGSTDAGAKQLYSMMDKVRKARTGKKAQGREINPRKYVPA
jgi:hypothetical protein